VEYEFDVWLGRARYERRPEYQSGLVITSRGCVAGSLDGATGRGELEIPVKLSKAAASRMCEELKERFAPFKSRSLYEVDVVALFPRRDVRRGRSLRRRMQHAEFVVITFIETL
jgi:hypothetical protein